eukprot:m.266561 g.266561  ORF g.266561 m.266561 type:complete len:791 (+) comp26767_c1_seq1:1070-3442(+)
MRNVTALCSSIDPVVLISASSAMGAANEPMLKAFAGPDPIRLSDAFWLELLRLDFAVPRTPAEIRAAHAKYRQMVANLVKNDTGNLYRLLMVVTDSVWRVRAERGRQRGEDGGKGKQPERRHLLDNKIREACRGIFIAQTCLVYCVETHTPNEVLWHLERATTAPSPDVDSAVNESHLGGADCDIADSVDVAVTDLTTPRRTTSIAMQGSLVVSGSRQNSLLARSPYSSVSSDITNNVTGRLIPPTPLGEDERPPVDVVFHFIEALTEALQLRVSSSAGEIALQAVNTLLILGTAGNVARDASRSGAPAEAMHVDGDGGVRARHAEEHRALFFSPVIHQRDLAVKAVGALLRAYSSAAGSDSVGTQAQPDDDSGIISGFLSVLSNPWQATSAVIFGDDDDDADTEVSARLRRDVVELLVLLLSEPTAPDAAGSVIPNQCLVALSDLEDANGKSAPPSPGVDRRAASAGAAVGPTRAPFAALHSGVCAHAREFDGKIMLYTLLVESNQYSEYVAGLGPGDAATLALPVFQQLYGFQRLGRRHTQLLLAGVLRLSETRPFLSGLHAVETDAPWYLERVLTQISCGNLLLVVLLRTIQSNLKAPRDEYIHVVALAILSNCATHFHDVHTYVAERLVAVCALVAKNFLRTLDQGPEAATEFGRTVGVLLATINTCLTTNPAANTNLIYSLMAHKKDFDPLRSCGHFASEVENIFIVVDHFERRLERHGTTTLSVNTVLDVIREGGNRMPTTQLKRLPAVTFGHIEGLPRSDFWLWCLRELQGLRENGTTEQIPP